MKVMIETCCGINVPTIDRLLYLRWSIGYRLTKENSEEILDDYYHSSKCFSLVVRKSCHPCFL